MTGTTLQGAGSVGIYGKIATQGDFLRANAGQFSRFGLDQWFQAGVEVLHKEALTLPREPTAFVMVPEAASATFLGVFVPSTDAVGRSFPLIIFVEAAIAKRIDDLVTLARAYPAFLGAAGALAETGANLAAAELVEQSQTLMPSGASTAEDQATWSTSSSIDLVNALGGAPGAVAYAMRTFVTACEQAVKLDPSGRGGVIVIDAPAPTPATHQMWLECARRRLQASTTLISAFWTAGASGRLLLALGAAPPAVLSYLANPKHRASRFWPLRTEVASALDQADKALTGEQRRLLSDPTAALGELVTAFC